MNNPTRTLLLLLASLALVFALAGCSDDESSPTSAIDPTEEPATADKDAAEAVASDVGAETGGLTDQIADMAWAMNDLGGDKDGVEDGHRPSGSLERIYDDETGTWTVTIMRERGNPEGVPYAMIERQYTLRFLDELGEPMMYRVVDADTARTAEFAIVYGEGIHRNRRIEQQLDALSGSFVITDVNQELVTINGTYHREAGYHLETPYFSRTLDGVLDLELIDVVAPFRWRLNHQNAVSGTIEGLFAADVTIERGDDYIEDHIERDFTIVFGDGEATMTMNGGGYCLNLGTGELCDD